MTFPFCKVSSKSFSKSSFNVFLPRAVGLAQLGSFSIPCTVTDIYCKAL